MNTPHLGRILWLFEASAIDPGELDAVRNHTDFVVSDCVLDVQLGDLVIARHSMWPWPRRVETQVKRLGGTLLNDRRAYVYADDPSSWSYDLDELTPKTYTDFSTLPAFPEHKGFIVKGAKADKSRWNKMFAADKQQAINLLVEMNNNPRFDGQQIVAREYVPLKRLGCWDGKSCPVSMEFRLFFYGSRMLSSGFYWPVDDAGLSSPPDASIIPSSLLSEAAERVSPNIPFFTLDVAQKEDGNWVVIEISDGQRAGLSENDPEMMYSNLYKSLRGMT